MPNSDEAKVDEVMFYAQQLDSLRDQIYDLTEEKLALRKENKRLEERVAFLDAEKRRIAVLAGLEPDDPKPQPYVPIAIARGGAGGVGAGQPGEAGKTAVAFTPTSKLKANRARCRKCDDTIESRTVHDYVECYCGAMHVDGGLEYLKRGGDPDDIEELSEYEK